MEANCEALSKRRAVTKFLHVGNVQKFNVVCSLDTDIVDVSDIRQCVCKATLYNKREISIHEASRGGLLITVTTDQHRARVDYIILGI